MNCAVGFGRENCDLLQEFPTNEAGNGLPVPTYVVMTITCCQTTVGYGSSESLLVVIDVDANAIESASQICANPISDESISFESTALQLVTWF